MSTCIEIVSPTNSSAFLSPASYEVPGIRKPMVQASYATKSASSRALIKAALEQNILPQSEEIFQCDTSAHEFEAESAFFVADLGEVRRQYQRWVRLLPRVVPHYAVKCNPDKKVLELLAGLGTGFDCASKAEISAVLGLGVKPDCIIYANPCKAAGHIKYAAKVGVQAVTFDNAEELYKLAKFNPTAQLYLRILTDDSGALCQLGLKYGAPMTSTVALLTLAKQLNLNVVGVSFHVGSGSNDPYAFHDAILRSRTVVDEAQALGFTMHTLDIGGGFGHDNFDAFARVIGPALDHHFDRSIRVIAEPGRYFVANAFTLATQIIARRALDDGVMYYLNDGVYGSFNCIMFDHQHPVPRVLYTNNKVCYGVPARDLITCSVWGPTCDSLDCIAPETQLPRLEVGDWLYFDEMGAYTKCAASTFNGFNISRVVYVS